MNKIIMNQTVVNKIKKLFPYVYRAYREEFALSKFHRNNVMIAVLSLFLFFEQLMYAFQVSAPGSNRQMVYAQSALAMLFFCRSQPLFISSGNRRPSIIFTTFMKSACAWSA